MCDDKPNPFQNNLKSEYFNDFQTVKNKAIPALPQCKYPESEECKKIREEVESFERAFKSRLGWFKNAKYSDIEYFKKIHGESVQALPGIVQENLDPSREEDNIAFSVEGFAKLYNPRTHFLASVKESRACKYILQEYLYALADNKKTSIKDIILKDLKKGHYKDIVMVFQQEIQKLEEQKKQIEKSNLGYYEKDKQKAEIEINQLNLKLQYHQELLKSIIEHKQNYTS